MLANCMSGQHNWTSMQHVKALVKTVLSELKLRSRGKFWGYFRSLEDQLQSLKKAGFKKFEVGQHGTTDSFWIKAMLQE